MVLYFYLLLKLPQEAICILFYMFLCDSSQMSRFLWLFVFSLFVYLFALRLFCSIACFLLSWLFEYISLLCVCPGFIAILTHFECAMSFQVDEESARVRTTVHIQ